MGLILWGYALSDVLRVLKISKPKDTSTERIRWARNLYYTSLPRTVWERVATAVWDYYIQEEIKLVSSFIAAQDLFIMSRPGSPGKKQAFNTLLQYVDTREKAQFVVNLVQKGTDDARLANEKLSEF